MLNLASTSDLLKVTAGSAGTIEVHATWVDLLTTTGAVTPGRTNTADITGTGATTVVGSPSSSTIRNVKLLSVRNSHASVSNAITVSHTDGTTEHILWKGTLAPDESVVYSEATGWIRLNAAGTPTGSNLAAQGNELGVPVTATANLTGGSEIFIAGENVTAEYAQPIKQQLTAVCVGNSISALAKWDGARVGMQSEIHLANSFAGSPLKFPRRASAGTRMDEFGVYGYGGQTLATINTDMVANVWDLLDASSIEPDVVVGLALSENDLVNYTVFSTIKTNIDVFIRDTQARYPGVVLHLYTPRPSLSFNTPLIKSLYSQTRDYYLTLDNSRDVFVTNADVYEDKALVGVPITFKAQVVISGTSAVLSGVTDQIRGGMNITFPGMTGTPYLVSGPVSGGDGTYVLSVSQGAYSGEIVVCKYTDRSVHPNAFGSLLLARRGAKTLKRIASRVRLAKCKSTNFSLSGSAVASGTNVSGTVPTSCAVGGSVNAAFVSVAEAPGWLVSIVANSSAGPQPLDIGTINCGALAVPNLPSARIFAEIEIVSGAENLRCIHLYPRVLDSAANNTFCNYIGNTTLQVSPDLQNGDVLTLCSLTMLPVAGTITSITTYIMPLFKLPGGSASFRVKRQGVMAGV